LAVSANRPHATDADPGLEDAEQPQPYVAMDVAATEQLMTEHDGRAMLATADGCLAKAPTVSVPIELFVPDGSSS
jgi:hypothetical protein